MEADSFNFVVYNNKQDKWARLGIGQDEFRLQLRKYMLFLRIQPKKHSIITANRREKKQKLNARYV